MPNSKILNINNKSASGFTMIELVIAMAINLILVLVVGVLFVNGNRAWQHTFNSAHSKIEEDAYAITIAFGSVGRKANRLNYRVYKKTGINYKPVKPSTQYTEEVVYGDAVEFRYWDVEFDQSDSHHLLDTTKTATAYAFFYHEGTQLKVDYGPYPPGAIPEGGGHRNTTNVTTIILAENISVDNHNDGAFSHTMLGQNGQGSVRLNITLTDPESEESTQVITSTLMRNIWPR